MTGFDLNCAIGNWPFRKLGHNKPDDIIKVHRQNNITGGCISCLDSIFYNDPYEGDEAFSDIIKDMNYMHIQSVNPILSFTLDDIKRGVEFLGIKGVKIYPCYHSYELDCKELESICEYLALNNLPLFVQLRMEDYRADYIMLQKQLGPKDIGKLIQKYPDNKIVLLTIRINEIMALAGMIKESKNILLDTSGLKDGLFPVEKILDAIGDNQLAYGSLYPLFCLKSTLMLVEEAEIEADAKQKVLYDNAAKFLGIK